MNFLTLTLMVMREYNIGPDTLRWVQIGDKWMPWEMFVQQAVQIGWSANHERDVRGSQLARPKPIEGITIVGEGWIMQWSKREEDSECHWRVTRYNHAKPTKLALSIFDSNQR